MTIIKGARIGDHTDKTMCCDHCGRREHFGPIAIKQVSYLAWREGWVRLLNEGDSWNLCPDCSAVPTVSTLPQHQENHL